MRSTLCLLVFCMLPMSALGGQIPDRTSPSHTGPHDRQTLGAAEHQGLENLFAVKSASATTSTLRLRPILVGIALGGVAGAVIGHEIGGGPRSCPTSPGYSCGTPTIGTFSGAVLGLVLGGAVGALIGSRDRESSASKTRAAIHLDRKGIGLSYAGQF